jgi:hypothetical protein
MGLFFPLDDHVAIVRVARIGIFHAGPHNDMSDAGTQAVFFESIRMGIAGNDSDLEEDPLQNIPQRA